MVPKQWINKFTEILKKYRYALIVLLIGLLLMALPSVSRGINTSEMDSDISSASPAETLNRSYHNC